MREEVSREAEVEAAPEILAAAGRPVARQKQGAAGPAKEEAVLGAVVVQVREVPRRGLVGRQQAPVAPTEAVEGPKQGKGAAVVPPPSSSTAR